MKWSRKALGKQGNGLVELKGERGTTTTIATNEVMDEARANSSTLALIKT